MSAPFAIMPRQDVLTAVAVRLDDPSWQKVMESRPEASFFHDPRWARLVADCYGMEASAFVGVTAAGLPVAGLPFVEVRFLGRRRWVSLPFSDHCAVLADDATTPGFIRALDRERIRRGVDALEIRASIPQLAGATTSLVGYQHQVTLTPNTATMLAGMSRMHRGSIRKAERLGVNVTQSTNTDQFYALHLQTRRRLGVPVQPRRLFRLIESRILKAGAGFVLTARLGDRPVAAGVFLTFRDRILFKYSASDERAWDARPNHLLAWTAMKIAAERGFTQLDWGRSDPGNEGLRTYKLAFGSTEEPLGYSSIGRTDPAGAPRGAAHALSAVIRHSPSWVCRFAGETLYRYAL